jgi:phospholipase/carboxylesterase
MNRLVKAIRYPRTGAAPRKALVLLHGLGSNEQDLLGFASELDPALLYIAFRAPLDYGPGFAWFNLNFGPMGISIDREQAIQSRDLLIAELESAPELAGLPVVLGGFSQGAIMTLGVATERPDLLSGAILLSGLTIPSFTAHPNPAVAQVPFLIQHGIHDPVLPVSGARTTRDFLQMMGSKVLYSEYEMGHEISSQSIADIANWVAAL